MDQEPRHAAGAADDAQQGHYPVERHESTMQANQHRGTLAGNMFEPARLDPPIAAMKEPEEAAAARLDVAAVEPEWIEAIRARRPAQRRTRCRASQEADRIHGRISSDKAKLARRLIRGRREMVANESHLLRRRDAGPARKHRTNNTVDRPGQRHAAAAGL